MQQTNSVNVHDFINQNKFSPYQVGVFILTTLVALLDGFDTAAIGYIAPYLLNEFGVDRSMLAPVLSAALLGLATGALSSGPLADKIGRKSVLLISSFVFMGFGSLMAARAQTLGELEFYRFFTGIGLGAAMPNAITLLSEYCNDKNRYFIVNTMASAFPIGAAAGGFLAAWIIPEYGWRSVLNLGGYLPLILSVILFFFLPESVRYLVVNKKPDHKIKTILMKISQSAESFNQFVIDEGVTRIKQGTKTGLSLILSRHYLLGSMMLWISYFMGLIIFYGIINWLPLLFSEANIPKEVGARVTGLFALGGVGAIASGWLMGRYNANKLISYLFLFTAIFVGIIGFTINNTYLLITIILIAGLFQNTGSSSIPSLASDFYPTEGRTSGVSWTLGIGRFGGIAGSFLVAWLLHINLSIQGVFLVLGSFGFIAALAMLIKQIYYPIKK